MRHQHNGWHTHAEESEGAEHRHDIERRFRTQVVAIVFIVGFALTGIWVWYFTR